MNEIDREAVFERDEYECRNCGASEDEARLTCHHVVPLLMGGEDTPSNAVTLCGSCHDKVHSLYKMASTEMAEKAIQERIDRGMWQGRPPVGLKFDDAGEYLVPSEEFDTVMKVFDRLADGETYASISSDLDIATGTITRIKERGKEFYEERRKRSITNAEVSENV